MTILSDLLGSLTAKLVATGGLFAAVLAAWVGFAMHYENKGAAKEVAKIEKKAEVLNEKAGKAHVAAQRPGAADRLRQRYCTDC